MPIMTRMIIACSLILWTGFVTAQDIQVQGLRMWPAPDNTRLVFDVSAPVRYKVFTLDKPDRIVIDLANTRLERLPQLDLGNSILTGIRTATRNQRDLRVVLDLKVPVRPKSFTLAPYQDYGHRLVVDLYDSERKPVTDETGTLSGTAANQSRDVVIAIDAGHGGEDPGARGGSGTREKDVVLAIARKLEALVRREQGMRPVMIRNGDYYIGLRKRMKKARTHKADLFVSIHADAFSDRRAHGASVYVLSQRGASSEAARWLAESENAADLIGGVSLDNKDGVLASVLLDLSQTATIEDSVGAGGHVLNSLRRVARVHKRRVQHAGFVVLKSPDIPSILIETAFISNPREERNLRSSAFQKRMAGAIFNGVRDYFHQNPPPGSWIASRAHRRHVIARGDTLSEIAVRYQVSLQRLRSANRHIKGYLRVGDVLTIPSRRDS